MIYVYAESRGLRHLVAQLSTPPVTHGLAEKVAHLAADFLKAPVYMSDRKPHVDNPTLVHHGVAKRAAFHLWTDTPSGRPQALADVYLPTTSVVKRMARELATAIRAPVKVAVNHEVGFLEHRKSAATFTPNPVRRDFGADAPKPGQLWRELGGSTARIISVTPQRVQLVSTTTGNRAFVSRGEFASGWRPVKVNKRRRRAPKRSAAPRKNAGKRPVRLRTGRKRTNTRWQWVTQHVEPAKSKAQAQEYLDGLKLQQGFIAGRIIGDGRSKPWAAQAFFPDAGAGTWLPEGTRRVIAPAWLLRSSNKRHLRRNPKGRTPRTAAEWVEFLNANGDDYHHGRITHAAFDRAQRAAWKAIEKSPRMVARVKALLRHKNPSSALERARDKFREWQDRGSDLEVRTRRERAPKPLAGAAAELGKLVAVTYRTDKYDGKTKDHEHVFKTPLASLVTDPDGRDLHIVRGRSRYAITSDGITN